MSEQKKSGLSESRPSLGFLREGLKSADLGDKEPSEPLGSGHKLLKQKVIVEKADKEYMAEYDDLCSTLIRKAGLKPVYNESDKLEIANYAKLYNLLDSVLIFLRIYLERQRNRDCYKQLRDAFSDNCNWALKVIAQTHIKNPAVTVETKDGYLRDWTDYIDGMYKLVQSVSQKTGFDLLEYDRLKNIRAGLFERGKIYFQAVITYFEKAKTGKQGKGLKVKTLPREAIQVYQLRNSIEFQGQSQRELAVIMNAQLRRTDIKPYMICRWLKQVDNWLKNTGLPVSSISKKPDEILTDPGIIAMGKRKDGITVRQRSKKSKDEGNWASQCIK